MIVARTGEIFLKNRNRPVFEKRLIDNMLLYAKVNSLPMRIDKALGRIFIYSKHEDQIDIRHIFGIVSYSHAIEVAPDEAAIIPEVIKLIPKDLKEKTYRVSVSRTDKNFRYDSLEFSKIIADSIGQYCVDNHGFVPKVSLKDFDVNFGIEIYHDKALIFIDSIEAAGGLPLGTQDNVLCVIDDDPSMLAAIVMMKRGCRMIPVAFGDATKIVSRYKKYFDQNNVDIMPVNDISEIPVLIERSASRAIVLGTIFDSLDSVDKRYFDYSTVLMPLIGYAKDEIENEVRKYLS